MGFGPRITDLLTIDVLFIIDGFASYQNSMNMFLTERAIPSKPTYFIVPYTVTIFIHTHTYTPSQVSAKSTIY